MGSSSITITEIIVAERVYVKNNAYFSNIKHHEQNNNIEAAEKFIYNFEAHRHDIENQTEIYSLLRDCELIATVNSQTKLLAKVRILLTEYFIQINDLENALKNSIYQQK